MEQYVRFVVEYWYLFAIAAGLSVALLWSILGDFVAEAAVVGPAEATRLINREDALVVDLRTAAEYEKGHILNAVHVPASQLKERVGELEKHRERPLILCCAHGADSRKASGVLAKAGFKRLYRLRGGVQAWTTEGLPLAADR